MLDGPNGMTINNTTGIVNWTPTASQIAAGSANVSIMATDAAGNTANQNFTIFFAPNEAPVLAPIANQTTDEHVTLNVTLSATDPNLPGDMLTYSIVGTPANATINATTGVFSFTPDDSQGGGTFSFTVRVTDAGGLSSEQSFSVSVNDTNSPPTSLPIGVIPALEHQELVVALPVSDVDLPSNTLTFQILNAPAGATIDSLGVFRWTPGELDGDTTKSVSVLVEDGVGGTLTVNFTINVLEANILPVLTVDTAFTVDEHAKLSFTAQATDADAPAQTLTFGLLNAPAGMTIDPTSGVVTWTPSEAQGPGQFTFQVRVQDDHGGVATQNVTVTVNEVNQAPTIGAMAGQSAFQGDLFRFNVPGVDGDLPIQTLTYTLLSGPAGMSINAATGTLSWAIPSSGATGSYLVSIQVADSAGLTAVGSFGITVSEFNFATFGFANGFLRSTTSQTPTLSQAAVVRAAETIRDTTTVFIPSSLPTDTLEEGLNRIQAVNDEELLQSVQKPAIDDPQVRPVANEVQVAPKSNASPQPSPSLPAQPKPAAGNPFDDFNAPAVPKAPSFDSSFDGSRHRQLRGLVLASEAVSGPALPWSDGVRPGTFDSDFPQSRSQRACASRNHDQRTSRNGSYRR
ncbi:MAG: putative Ig domain-containing protein [Pirellulales bacterium]